MTDQPKTPPNRSDSDEHTTDQVGAGGLVAVLSTDLFFGMRIRTALRQMEFSVSIAKDVPAFSSLLATDDQLACLGIVDFNYPVDWEAIGQITNGSVPILAFGPHKDVEGFRAAKRAGVTRVVANGEFTKSLPDLALRYATKSP